MVTRREWYERVNAEWPHGREVNGVWYPDMPAKLPPLSFEEAVRAYRKLYRFVHGKASKLGAKHFRRSTGRSRTDIYQRKINPDDGWQGLVHHLSHRFCPGGHGGEHARMERRLIKEVKRRGWLDGKLKSPEKPKAAPPPKSVIVGTKLDHAQRMMMRAATRAKRAQTILKKWQRKVRYYERQTVQP